MVSSLPGPNTPSYNEDEWLFGWDPLPKITSVWANREGLALIWRREGEQVICTRDRFRPWLFAASLDDLAHVRSSVLPEGAPGGERALVAYRLLEGPEGSFRYLITARDGRALERLLLEGARRRLGREVKSLNELGDDYYHVGPVEQYLIQSGRVYFRDMAYEEIHRMQIDLETTSLSPDRGRIFLVAVHDSRGLVIILEAPHPDDERQLILDLCQLVRERDPDVLENHGLFSFDLPFLEARATALGVPLALGRKGGRVLLERFEEVLSIGPESRRRSRYGVVGRELIDTLDAVRRFDFSSRELPSYRLKDVARYFGIAAPDRVYLEGGKIYQTYRTDPERVRHYALDDVMEVDGLSQRLMGAPFALASMAPRRYERLVTAGPATGVLEPILVRAYLYMGAALPRQAANQRATQEVIEGGAVYLFAEGIAEHIAKADVASLYPSLMIAEKLSPASDRLGVLLSILGRLTDLRLAHKAAARSAHPGSREARSHEATNLAMKIIINAAYGYMGAGSIALFADARAAALVTQRGREILAQVLEALRKRGMTLIEADTDGVYFAVPTTWQEEDERALVAEVAAELPPQIVLEYDKDSRAAAMFSHEVKNYALLRYDGTLVVHGAELRSSRNEPFGVRFLRRALVCAMTGDVVGVRKAFLETVEALRARKLPASDVATRVRLSKTPQEYLARRSSHAEPQYEALLSAGRSSWTLGERVRFYRARGGKAVWLPDETDEFEEDEDQEAGDDQGVSHQLQASQRDYDVEYYLQLLIGSYASRLRKAFAPADFERLFRIDQQLSLFDQQPLEAIQPRWIRCPPCDPPVRPGKG